jgi:HEPN domain-containing protein
MAESALGSSLYRPVVFHCQQAIEKILKAIWIEQADEGVPPKTHGLVELAKEVDLELDDEG